MAIEETVFPGDRISSTSFQRFIKKNEGLVVAEQNGLILGYVLTLYRARTSIARLYSLAVAPATQGKGLGKRLMQQAEQDAWEKGCIALRLEVRSDNQKAQSLYQSLGYTERGRSPGYYEDGQEAIRLEKLLTLDSVQTTVERIIRFERGIL